MHQHLDRGGSIIWIEWGANNHHTAADKAHAALAPREQITHTLESGLLEIYAHIEAKLLAGIRPVIVLVAGWSASWKTSRVAERIQKLYKENSKIISLDSFYRGPTFMQSHPELNWDHPEALNLAMAAEKIGQLKEWKTVKIPHYNFLTDPTPDAFTIEPTDVIIVEWLFSLRGEFINLWDVTTYVDISPHGRLIRRLIRDAVEQRTGQTIFQSLRQITSQVEKEHLAHVDPTKANAQVLITNEYNPLVESMRTGRHEKQLKLSLGSDFFVDTILNHPNVRIISSMRQDDEYYTPRTDSPHPQEILRIRNEQPWEQQGKTIPTMTMTYKWPEIASEGKYILWCQIDAETHHNLIQQFVIKKSLISITKKRIELEVDDELYGKIRFRLDNLMAKWEGIANFTDTCIELVLPEGEESEWKFFTYAKTILEKRLKITFWREIHTSYKEYFKQPKPE